MSPGNCTTPFADARGLTRDSSNEPGEYVFTSFKSPSFFPLPFSLSTFTLMLSSLEMVPALSGSLSSSVCVYTTVMFNLVHKYFS